MPGGFVRYIGEVQGRDVLLTAITPVTFGTTYVITTQFLPPDRPLLAALVRALPAGLVLLAVARRLPHGVWWWRSLVLGALNFGFFFPLLFLSAYRLPGGVAATLGAIQPLIVATLAARLVGERLTVRAVVAGLAGVVGVGLLVLQAGARLDLLGILAALGGTLSMAAGIVLTKRWGRPASPLAVASWQLIAGSIVLLPLVVIVEGAPPPLTAINLAGFAWLTLVGTALAYTLWFRGIGLLPVTTVAFLGLLSPVVAVLIGWLALGQGFTGGQVLGVVIVFASLIVVLRHPSDVAASRPAPDSSERRSF